MITALFYDYTKQLPVSVLTEMNRIYEEETGKTLSTNYGCSNCIVKLVKMCAILYFTEYKDRLPDKLKDRWKI